ncbi:MAG: rhamnose utilization protein RhaD (predicted bifunctional aldolase and dehydrogenase) [Pseudohongiellaceae bacterium]|jgi:rhamnose utilization protein RhaD (predicted bifunctional aldolase and dehydrogenase)/NAD(P)-dependent dehydrogenase (short-subunit alcohol dehydrogenase family)
MKNRWNNETASLCSNPVALRAYSSRLLGADSNLVLHGGGNTSVKGSLENVFGERQDVLFVKGSGWDLRTIEEPGFPPVQLDYLARLGQLDSLSDGDMMKHLRLALLDPAAPTPSVEAILHALIPHIFVDHTHADAVVTISNSPNSKETLASIYGEEVLILPYIMPGFVLAKQVADAAKGLNWQKLRGIILLSHGIFTFHEDAKTSYDTMIELVSKAEDYIASQTTPATIAKANYYPNLDDAKAISVLRRAAGDLLGKPCLVHMDYSAESSGFAGLPNFSELATRGPLTPDHTIHGKAFAAVFDDDLLSGLQAFAHSYRVYFEKHSLAHHQCLDLMPRYGVWKDKGVLYFGGSSKRVQIIKDITAHTIVAIQTAEALGGWQALSPQDLFDVEYWELEQAKLTSTNSSLPLEGKVAVVTGAGSGIGRATVLKLLSEGCAVVGLDILADFADSTASFLAIQCDVTDPVAVASALSGAVFEFGGIDMLVSNAGVFPSSCMLEHMDIDNWDRSLAVNLSSHMQLLKACIPFLKSGFDPSVVIIGSKNVPAPGPGAAAYSVAKAGLTQLARVAALELGEFGIRVNTLHPNSVYDTAIWNEEVLAKRAQHYGLSVDEYKSHNVLKTQITSADVATSVVRLLGTDFSKTTGAQIAVDGGNDRVI